MADLNIISNFEVLAQGGGLISGKQGLPVDTDTDPVVMDVEGDAHLFTGTLATATAVEVWNNASDQPVTWDYLFVWSSVDMYLQVIGETGNAIFDIRAKVPFQLAYCEILVAANTTPLSGTEPTTEAIETLVLQNNSGGSGNFRVALVA